jgi:hypothetical protein
MAGDWLKVEKVTPDKPEIAILARKLGVSQGEAFLSWFRVYSWADGITCPGFVPHLSPEDADTASHAAPGTCSALASREIGWLATDGGGIQFINWDRHNGKSAKSRALEAEKKRKQREKKEPEEPDLSRECPDEQGTKSGPEKSERRARGESPSLKSERESKGNQRSISRSPSRSPLDAGEGEETPIDTSAVSWERVCDMAARIGRRIPAASDEDRRTWFRYAALVDMGTCSEHWLADSIEAALKAKNRRSTLQGCLVGIAKSKAAEEGIEEPVFLGMVRRIEIPDAVWKSGVLEVRK